MIFLRLAPLTVLCTQKTERFHAVFSCFLQNGMTLHLMWQLSRGSFIEKHLILFHSVCTNHCTLQVL